MSRYGCAPSALSQSAGLQESACSIVAVEEVPRERVHMYGVVGVGAAKGKAFAITKMVRSRNRPRRPPISPSPAATSCSRKSSTCSASRRPAPAAKSS